MRKKEKGLVRCAVCGNWIKPWWVCCIKCCIKSKKGWG